MNLNIYPVNMFNIERVRIMLMIILVISAKSCACLVLTGKTMINDKFTIWELWKIVVS